MLKQRIITALVLIFLFGAITILLPPFWYALLIGAVILAAAWEWSVLTGLDSMAGRLVYLCLLIVAGALLFAWLGVTPAAVALNRTETALLLGVGLAFWLLVLFLLLGYPGNRVRWDSGARIGAMGALALLPSLMGVIYLKYLMPAGYLVLALVAAVAAVDIGAFFLRPRFRPQAAGAGDQPEQDLGRRLGRSGGLLVGGCGDGLGHASLAATAE